MAQPTSTPANRGPPPQPPAIPLPAHHPRTTQSRPTPGRALALGPGHRPSVRPPAHHPATGRTGQHHHGDTPPRQDHAGPPGHPDAPPAHRQQDHTFGKITQGGTVDPALLRTMSVASLVVIRSRPQGWSAGCCDRQSRSPVSISPRPTWRASLVASHARSYTAREATGSAPDGPQPGSQVGSQLHPSDSPRTLLRPLTCRYGRPRAAANRPLRPGRSVGSAVRPRP